MTLQFVRDRLTSLRMKKGISEAEMSRALGHSKGYMQAISSGRRMMPRRWPMTMLCLFLIAANIRLEID